MGEAARPPWHSQGTTAPSPGRSPQGPRGQAGQVLILLTRGGVTGAQRGPTKEGRRLGRCGLQAHRGRVTPRRAPSSRARLGASSDRTGQRLKLGLGRFQSTTLFKAARRPSRGGGPAWPQSGCRASRSLSPSTAGPRSCPLTAFRTEKDHLRSQGNPSGPHCPPGHRTGSAGVAQG